MFRFSREDTLYRRLYACEVTGISDTEARGTSNEGGKPDHGRGAITYSVLLGWT